MAVAGGFWDWQYGRLYGKPENIAQGIPMCFYQYSWSKPGYLD